MQKLQRGGTVNFHVIANSSFAQADQGATAAKKTKSSDTGLVNKDLLKDLYEKGIPADVDKLVDEIAELEHRQSIGLPVAASDLQSINKQINRVIQNANYLEAAEKRAEKNDSLADIAVDARGYIYCANEEGIKKKHFQDYDAEKDQALTVGDLITFRKNSPSLAFNSDYIQTIGTSIGTSAIQKYITDIVKTVGESTSASEAYTNLASIMGSTSRPSEKEFEQISNMASIAQTMGTDAIFKQTTEVQQQNFQAGLKYIYSVLPQNMKNQLAGQFVAMGGKADKSGDYIVDLISTALESGSRNSYKEKLDYDKSANDGAGTTKANQRNLKAIEVLTQGTLNKTDYHLTSAKNPSLQMTLHGNVSGVLTNYDNNIIPKAPISTAIESSIGPLIDKNHITMGDQKINASMFDTILYDGNEVINIWAPTDANGDIDLAGLQQFNDILDYFSQDPSLTIADKNRILQQYGIQGTVDDNNNFHGTGNMAQFFVFTGITSDEVLSKDNIFADVLDKDQKDYELQQIERIYGQLNSKIKNKDGHLKFNKGWFDWSTDIMKAPVFMKMHPTAQQEVGALSNYGPRVTQQTYENAAVQDQMRYNRQNSQQVYKPSTSLIYE